MGDMLSQEEIDALLKGTVDEAQGDASNNSEAIEASEQNHEPEQKELSPSDETHGSSDESAEELLTAQEIDALGEIGNISMGTAATTLFTLLGQKVVITTPQVTVLKWEEFASQYTIPYVAVFINYTQGLVGNNILVLKEHDTKVITDLMLGGDGINTSGTLEEMHLSAIAEAMNQMIGSASTSMSSLLNQRIDISPPRAELITFSEGLSVKDFETQEGIVKISFKMIIGDLVNSEIMELIPISFAKRLVASLLGSNDLGYDGESTTVTSFEASNNVEDAYFPQSRKDEYYDEREYSTGNDNYRGNQSNKRSQPVNVQPANFQELDDSRYSIDKKNISLIMDVPLEVTVELGRTNKLIREVLEFGPGSIIELDKLAGEPVDILVNGKVIAKGEVVVIDESFGVRVTDIVHPSKRL